MSTRITMLRIAIRHEGEFINAYYAEENTMVGALLLGSLRSSLADANPDLYEIFKDLMRVGISHMIQDMTGIEPSWDGERSAPEHELAGKA